MTPQVGIGVLIFRQGKVLLGRRKGSHGALTWATPGGHLEFGESPEECARREVAEETGLQLGEIKEGRFVSDVFYETGKHYITLFMICHSEQGDAQCLEPQKCEGWFWFSLNALPSPLFAPLQTLINAHGLEILEKAK